VTVSTYLTPSPEKAIPEPERVFRIRKEMLDSLPEPVRNAGYRLLEEGQLEFIREEG
jgi:hypothetical protein